MLDLFGLSTVSGVIHVYIYSIKEGACAYASANTHGATVSSVSRRLLWPLCRRPNLEIDYCDQNNIRRRLLLCRAWALPLFAMVNNWVCRLWPCSIKHWERRCCHSWRRTIGTVTVSSKSRRPLWPLCRRGLSPMRMDDQAKTCGLGLTPHLKSFAESLHVNMWV